MSHFNLDKAIAAWRQNLERSGSFLEEDLDELGAHLRDHVDALTEHGLPAKEAFDAALERLGSRSRMESEYRKVRLVRSKRKRSVAGVLTREWELTKNYLITALRNVRRHKSYAFINVSGLAVAIAACLLIGLYVHDELSYDRHHEHAARIAAVGQESRGQRYMSTPFPLASTLEANMPEVERGVRLLQRNVEIMRQPGAEKIELNALFTDDAFLDVFTFPLLAGSREHALDDPNSIILMRASAEKLFERTEYGSIKDVHGQTVLLDYWGEERTLTVTAVVDDPPAQSTLNFGLITPLAGLPDDLPREGSWGAQMYRTFILLDGPGRFAGLDERINRTVDQYDGRDEPPSYTSEPLTQLYLSGMYRTSGFRGSKRYVYIFASVALLILLVAAINYINLATALATRRTREVGVRKTLGAFRSQLVRQFTVESVLLSLVALLLALGLSRLFLSGFNHIFGKDLRFTADLALLIGLSAGCLAVGIAAGGYPAVLLSGLRPRSVLKGTAATSIAGRGRLRQGLIVFQFAISVALIVGTVVIHRQLEFAQTKNLGFEGEQVVSVELPRTLWESREDVQRHATMHASVVHASVANAAPSSVGVLLGFRPEEVSPEARSEEEMIMFAPAVVDYDYVESLGLELLAGRDFSSERASDRTQAYILNRSAVAKLGWTVEDAVGKPFKLSPSSHASAGTEDVAETFGAVIGVVEDFHVESLRQEIKPVVLQLREDDSWSAAPVLLAKLSPTGITAGLEHVQTLFERLAPDETFTYEFLDDRFDAMYRDEERLGQIFTSFGALAIFLACMGLFGLSAYAAESRTKEIGIRKVLGASIRDVITLLSRNFLLLVAAGFLIAVPVSYLIMDRWLEDFAYRIEISPAIMLTAGFLTLALALAAVIYQSMRAALRNPTESLRYE